VATSGDTGGAVADGFFGVEGIRVTVLYPKGRISPLQERQIAGLGENITAIAVEGSFDDCQALVKAAFKDPDLCKRRILSSANSINIARLVPQAVYYSVASGRFATGKYDADGEATPRRAGALRDNNNDNIVRAGHALPLHFSVPSGNFGNLTAGMYARALGAPIAGFVAATNINKTVPDYLASGVYEPRESRATLSNAMDVGAPSNFERMSTQWNYSELCAQLKGTWTTDDETRECIKRVYDTCGYWLDPHGAVSWDGMEKALAKGLVKGPVAALGTAHPAKFSETVEPLCGKVPVPPSLAHVMERTVNSVTIKNNIEELKEILK
jgi:threonine synthase